MTERNRKRLLWGVNAGLALGILAAAGLALAPLEPSVTCDPPPAPASTVAAAETHLAPLDAYDVISRRDLSGPLFDTAAAAASAPPAPMPPIRLTGTAVEPGFCYGFFCNTKGESKMVGIGESIEGAEVVAVAEQSVTLKFGGRTITMPVEKPAGAAGAAPVRQVAPQLWNPRAIIRPGAGVPAGGAVAPAAIVQPTPAAPAPSASPPASPSEATAAPEKPEGTAP